MKTLNIGLGGTGIKTLLNLRKLTNDLGKNLEQLNNAPSSSRYFIIDSNTKDINGIGDLLGITDNSTKKILDFKDFELVTYEQYITPSSIEEFKRQIDQGEHSHVSDWLEPTALDAIKLAAQAGAGQIRNVGRYGFFRAFNQIEIKLRDHFDKFELRHNEVLFVNIVCSIAGGTGSGSLVDLILLLNELGKKYKPNVEVSVEISIFIFLPETFEKTFDTDDFAIFKSQATAYAVLLELETLASSNTEPKIDLLSEKTKLRMSESFKVKWLADANRNARKITEFSLPTRVQAIPSNLWKFIYLLSPSGFPLENQVIDPNNNPAPIASNDQRKDFCNNKELPSKMYEALSDFLYLISNKCSFSEQFLAATQNPLAGAGTDALKVDIGIKSYELNNLYATFGISKVFGAIDKFIQVSSIYLLEVMFNNLTKDNIFGISAKDSVEKEFREWSLFDIKEKFKLQEKKEDVQNGILKNFKIFKSNIENIISGKTLPIHCLEEDRVTTSKEKFNLDYIDDLKDSFKFLKEALDKKLLDIYKDLEKKARELADDKEDNQITSLYEMIEKYIIKLLTEGNSTFAIECFENLENKFRDHEITIDSELRKLDPSSKGRNLGGINIPLPLFEDVKSIPFENQRLFSIRVLSESLIGEYEKKCNDILEYALLTAIKTNFIPFSKKYLDKNSDTSFHSNLILFDKYLNEVKSKINDHESSVLKAIKPSESPFFTPVPRTDDKTRVIKQFENAFAEKQNNNTCDYQIITKSILNELNISGFINWIKPIPMRETELSFGRIMLQNVIQNVSSVYVFKGPDIDLFIKDFKDACYKVLKKTGLGLNLDISTLFREHYSTQDIKAKLVKVGKKSSPLLDFSTAMKALISVKTKPKEYDVLISSSVNSKADLIDFQEILTKPALVSLHSENNALDHYYIVNVKYIFPLVTINSLDSLESSYKYVINNFSGNSEINETVKDAAQKSIKINNLHTDAKYFKYNYSPFTPDSVVRKFDERKRAVSVLIKAFMIQSIRKSNEGILFFSVLKGNHALKFDFVFSNFGDVLKQLVTNDWVEVLEKIVNDKSETISCQDVDIKIAIGLTYFSNQVESSFEKCYVNETDANKKVLIKELKNLISLSISDLLDVYKNKRHVIEQLSLLQEKYNDVKVKFDANSTHDNKPVEDFCDKFINLSFDNLIYVPVIKL